MDCNTHVRESFIFKTDSITKYNWDRSSSLERVLKKVTSSLSDPRQLPQNYDLLMRQKCNMNEEQYVFTKHVLRPTRTKFWNFVKL